MAVWSAAIGKKDEEYGSSVSSSSSVLLLVDPADSRRPLKKRKRTTTVHEQEGDHGFHVPTRTISLSGMSASERQELAARLREELEQVRALLQRRFFPSSRTVVDGVPEFSQEQVGKKSTQLRRELSTERRKPSKLEEEQKKREEASSSSPSCPPNHAALRGSRNPSIQPCKGMNALSNPHVSTEQVSKHVNLSEGATKSTEKKPCSAASLKAPFKPQVPTEQVSEKFDLSEGARERTKWKQSCSSAARRKSIKLVEKRKEREVFCPNQVAFPCSQNPSRQPCKSMNAPSKPQVPTEQVGKQANLSEGARESTENKPSSAAKRTRNLKLDQPKKTEAPCPNQVAVRNPSIQQCESMNAPSKPLVSTEQVSKQLDLSEDQRKSTEKKLCSAQSMCQISPERLERADLLKKRFASTIVRAQQKMDESNGYKVGINTQRQSELGREAEGKQKGEVEKEAKAKRIKREIEREASRRQLEQMKKTVEIDNSDSGSIMRELQMLLNAPSEYNLSSDATDLEDGEIPSFHSQLPFLYWKPTTTMIF